MADNTETTKIVIEGDSTNAVTALKGVVGALNTVRGAINRVMAAFGLFGLAVQGINAVIEGYKKLTEWMNRAAKAAGEIRWRDLMSGAANALDGVISRQKTLNSLLKDELSTLQRSAQFRELDEANSKEVADISREATRAAERADVTDPRAKMELEQRYRLEDEQRERAERISALDDERRDNENRAAIYGGKAWGAGEAIKETDAEIKELRSQLDRMNDEQREEAKKQIDALSARKKALEESKKEWEAEEAAADQRAAIAGKQARAILTAPSVAAAQNDAETKEFNRKEAEESRSAKASSLAAAAEFVKGHREEAIKDKEGQLSALESFGSRAAAVTDSVSTNRLTAMGLGSGVSGRDSVAGDVKKAVDLLKEEVEELKKLNEREPSISTFAE